MTFKSGMLGANVPNTDNLDDSGPSVGKSGLVKPPSKPTFGKAGVSHTLKTIKNPFQKDSAGKLSKSGSSTLSESLSRLRGKGALA